MRPRADRSRRRVASLPVIAALVVAGCGGGSGDADGPGATSAADAPAAATSVPDDAGSAGGEGATLSGVVREPAPEVDAATLPSLTEPGAEVTFRARPGHVQVVYFGFTNCPDVCPTTLADLTVALRRLDEERPGASERVDVVMVTVDPARDLDVLPDYIRSFVPGAAAAGTVDDDALRAAADPFGVSYEVRALDDGTVEVDHSPFLYAVDDEGRLAVSWQFGVSKDDLAHDLGVLLDRASA